MANKHKPKRAFIEVPLSPQTARATLVGRGKLYVENHSGLLEVAPHRVRVRTGYGELLITGTGLGIDTDGAGMICITGALSTVAIMGDIDVG